MNDLIRQLQIDYAAIGTTVGALQSAVLRKAKTVQEELDALPGRRIFFTMVGSQDFVAGDAGKKGNTILFKVNQDGPFVMTHYPVALWKVTTSGATSEGKWRPVATWNLPDQVVTIDTIDISYEFGDSGSNRNFQNNVPQTLLSKPNDLLPLPEPTLFAPNTAIAITPTYEAINFDSQGQADAGTLYFMLPGYRIVNL